MPNLHGDRTYPIRPIGRSGYHLDTTSNTSTLGGLAAACQPKKYVGVHDQH